MPSFQELEHAAQKYLTDFQGESFLFSEIAEEVLKQFSGLSAEEKENTEKKLRNILDTAESSLVRTFHGDRFYLLDRFLNGLVFRCKPRPFEIEAGILIPGARFEPFHSPELFVDELEIDSAYGKWQLKEYTSAYDKVEELYFLLGPAGALDMFHAECPENSEAIFEAGGLKPALRLKQSVFDLSDFYRETEFKSGDILKFTLDSYLNGTLHVEHESRISAPSPKDQNKWITDFEKALVQVCREYKDSFEIPVQLTYAYLYAKENGTDLRQIPAPPIDQYQTMMQSVGFRRSGAEWTLSALDEEEDGNPGFSEEEHDHECSCSHDHEHDHECTCGHDHKEKPLSHEDFTISEGVLESMDAILKDVKADFRETEFRAYVFDSIASGVEEWSEFRRIHDELFALSFTDEAQEAAYLNFAEDLWEYISGIYSFNLDSRKAPLRQRLLELCEKRREAVKRFGGKTEFLEKLEVIRRDIADTLAVLDSDMELPEGEACEDLELRIGDIEDALDDYCE